jgi:hypothetical protein
VTPHDDDERTTGREAPMVITPRDLVRLARQLTGVVARKLVRSAAKRPADRERRAGG